jgi:hypothetical protein
MAQAASIVEATTKGDFGLSHTATTSSGGVTLSFTGATLDTDSPTNNQIFGTFHVSGVGINAATFNDVPFTLTVIQTKPGNDSGTIAGQIHGKVKFGSDTLQLEVLGSDLVLNSTTLGVSNVTYTLLDGNIGNNIGQVTSFDANVFGNVSFTTGGNPAVPTPASAASGLVLLGGMAAAQLRKRRLQA